MLRPATLLLLVALRAPEIAAWGYCNDEDSSCARWAQQGQCDDPARGVTVKKKCPHSFSICPHTCRDEEEQCAAWADNGQCEENIDYMYKHCSASCGVCKTLCYDKDPACPAWARQGECKKNKDLHVTCPESCDVCTEMCLDRHNDCPQWAAAGQCSSNTAYMFHECPNSCQLCDVETKPLEWAPDQTLQNAHCADRDRLQCLIWGSHQCSVNPGAMMRDCPHLCGVCTLACADKLDDCPNWAKGKVDWRGYNTGKGCDENPAFMYSHCPHSCGICPRLHVFSAAEKKNSGSFPALSHSH